jgi:hypothetical protein
LNLIVLSLVRRDIKYPLYQTAPMRWQMKDDSHMECVRKRLNEWMKVAVSLSVQFCCLGICHFFLLPGKNKQKYWASASNMTRGDVQSRKSIHQGVYKHGSTCTFACLPVDVYLTYIPI